MFSLYIIGVIQNFFLKRGSKVYVILCVYVIHSMTSFVCMCVRVQTNVWMYENISFEYSIEVGVMRADMSIYISFVVTIQNGNSVFSTHTHNDQKIFLLCDANKSLRKCNCRKMQMSTTMLLDTLGYIKDVLKFFFQSFFKLHKNLFFILLNVKLSSNFERLKMDT